MRSVTVDFRRLYWLESFSGVVYSVDKNGRNLVEYIIQKPLTHIVAYSEGIQAIPGLSDYSYTVRLRKVLPNSWWDVSETQCTVSKAYTSRFQKELMMET